jgi:hypothetical protein
LFPFEILVIDSECFTCSFERFCNFAADVVKRAKVSLVGHAAGVEVNIFFIDESFNQKGKEPLQGCIFCLEELSSDNKSYKLLYKRMHDAAPSIHCQNLLKISSFFTCIKVKKLPLNSSRLISTSPWQ